MRLEIPIISRCCFCLPLRHGIAILGYLNLMFAIFVVGLESYLSLNYAASSGNMALYKGVSFYCQVWLTFVLYTIEIIFSIVLIIGAHLKKTKLLRTYYYYGITTTLATFVVFLVVSYEEIFNWSYYIVEASLAFCGFTFQVYLLLLLRSELKKLKERSRLSFVNHVSEIVVDGPLTEGRNPL